MLIQAQYRLEQVHLHYLKEELVLSCLALALAIVTASKTYLSSRIGTLNVFLFFWETSYQRFDSFYYFANLHTIDTAQPYHD